MPRIIGAVVDFTAEHVDVFHQWAKTSRHLGRYTTRDTLLESIASILAQRLEARESEHLLGDTKLGAQFIVRAVIMMLVIAVMEHPERLRDGTVKAEAIRMVLAYMIGSAPSPGG